jgi:hypothetical protein
MRPSPVAEGKTGSFQQSVLVRSIRQANETQVLLNQRRYPGKSAVAFQNNQHKVNDVQDNPGNILVGSLFQECIPVHDWIHSIEHLVKIKKTFQANYTELYIKK